MSIFLHAHISMHCKVFTISNLIYNAPSLGAFTPHNFEQSITCAVLFIHITASFTYTQNWNGLKKHLLAEEIKPHNAPVYCNCSVVILLQISQNGTPVLFQLQSGHHGRDPPDRFLTFFWKVTDTTSCKGPYASQPHHTASTHTKADTNTLLWTTDK